MTQFSVILPTHNRPDSFRAALGSVLAQQAADVEIIVVQDGSDADCLDRYHAIEAEMAGRARWIDVPRQRGRGHGHGFALNVGAAAAQGRYLCFLDDDDLWIDPDHLHRAGLAITQAGAVDLYLANQEAWQAGARLAGPIWIEDLPGQDGADCQSVTAASLLRASGFCHLNTLIVRRALYEALGGVDEGLCYECDRDFYLRAIDRAGLMLYAPAIVSRHNVPMAGARAHESTRVTATEKCLSQLLILDRLLLGARNPAIRRYAMAHKAYTLQRLATACANQGSYRTAMLYACQALAIRPSPRWLATTAQLAARAITAGDRA